MTVRCAMLLTGCCFQVLATDCFGQIDTSPLTQVKVVEVFEQLQWPAWITGEETGKPLDPRPIIITGCGDGSGRLFVATQYGTIYWFDNRSDASRLHPYLDIRDRVMLFKPKQNEEGFLGLAFHPRFSENGQLFVYYSCAPTETKPHRTRISRFRLREDGAGQADPDSEEILLEIDEPFWNHNGGTVVFGPDGFLYIGVGDGGAGNDPHMNGQNLHSLHGKILRIDVDRKQGKLSYAIPQDNPFVGQQWFACPEIWSYGLRNVWRPTFDRQTGVLWSADVGQDQWEEIDLIRRGGNYGWNLREGRHAFGPGGFTANENLVEPIWDYPHEIGNSITGGYVYRGKKIPPLVGSYLYADYVTGQIWALRYDHNAQQVTANRTVRANGSPVITFGEDDQGEVFFTSEREIFSFTTGE